MSENLRAPISATELAEMEVDAARGDLKVFDSIRLLVEVRRLRAEVETLRGSVDAIKEINWRQYRESVDTPQHGTRG